MRELAATAREHDAVTRAGSVLLDDGTLLHYDAAAFDAGRLRLLRSGQRVWLRLDGQPETIVAITLVSFDLPPAEGQP